jgi:hypothetical protein
MFILYYDESGDDGFPRYSSPLFVLSTNYIHDSRWREAFEKIRDFRRMLNANYGLPMKMEIHSKEFLQNKMPYRPFSFTEEKKIEIIDQYCECISQLPIQVVNVVINKLLIRKPSYPVLDNSLTYSVQRVVNTIPDVTEKLLIISDEGRIPKMRTTTRRLQVFNPIPSRFMGGVVAQRPIDRLIEDPLPKESQHSYFIQVSDLIAFLVYNYMLVKVSAGKINNRLPVEDQKIEEWLNIITPILNLKATSANKFGYGIVCYPLP